MNAGKLILGFSVALAACGSGNKTEKETLPSVDDYQEVAIFNGDSAYMHVAAQVEMGPRVPGSVGHARCLDYITGTFRRYGADTVVEQAFTAEAHTGEVLGLTNVVARYNAAAPRRILIGAHWDTRPWGDMDETREGRSTPIPGANDGGSGVGVILEIARVLQHMPPAIGVDLVLFDGEDYGRSSSWSNDEETWCLGSQYWKSNNGYGGKDARPDYAVVLDMVGGKGARFHKEVSSDIHASEVVDRVWDMARSSGYGDTFVNSAGGHIIDDHLSINRAGIPAIVVIESLNQKTNSFNPTWHTHQDDLSAIDRKSLKAVGQTMVNLIYEEGGQAAKQ